jgi:carboxyl-terminal processing protease
MRSKSGLVAALLLLASCAAQVEETSTTVAAPTTVPVASTSSTVPTQPYEVQGCTRPPVTFAALCDIYEAAQEVHVDAPFPAEDLAALALEGLRGFSTQETAPPPRTLICAIPDRAFEPLCAELAQRVAESRIPVGPAMEAAAVAVANLGLGPFSYYVPPEEVDAIRADGVVPGVGIMLDATDAAGSRCLRIAESCPLQVVFVLQDNPGEEAGLLAGDHILAVDGEPVDGRSFADLTTDLAGDETGTVSVTVQREGVTLPLVIERDELQIPNVEVELPLPATAYLRIPDFEDDIPGLVHEALTSLMESGPETIVVDLRDNPGGYINAAIEVASEFIPDGVVMIQEWSSGAEQHEAVPGGLATTERLVVMVNEGTASAAEIIAGALRDRRGAIIVGSTTFGKDAVQIPFKLGNGGELYLVVARWRTPAGHTVGTDGLVPDRVIDWVTMATLEDAVAAAIEAAS